MCSADHSFLDFKGQYAFDVNGLEAAHNACKAKFRRAFIDQVMAIVVDNTNIRGDEFSEYVRIADERTAHVKIIEFDCPDVLTAVRLSQRSPHSIDPQLAINRFRQYRRLPTEKRIVVTPKGNF